MSALFGRKKIEEKEVVKPVKKAAVESEKKEAISKTVKKQKIEKREFSSAAWQALKHPIVTEKSTNLAAKYNQYVYKIEKGINKNQVKNAIQELYGVRVESVNIMNVEGKKIKAGRRQKEGKRPGFKKAIITLAPGEKIDSGV